MKTRRLSMLLMVVFCLFFVARSAKSQDFSRLLSADKPAPEHKDQLMLFGQFVGAWEFEGSQSNKDGTRTTDKGEIHFAWVLQGRAIQDLWIEQKISDNRPKVYGTAMRI